MIEKWEGAIREFGFENCVKAEEIEIYLSAHTYEDDKISREEIIQSEYLMLHEIVEVCCLKRKGLKITKDVIMNNIDEVYECHLEAMEREIDYARKNGDEIWVMRRVRDLKSYLDDLYLPTNLRQRVLKLIEKYGD